MLPELCFTNVQTHDPRPTAHDLRPTTCSMTSLLLLPFQFPRHRSSRIQHKGSRAELLEAVVDALLLVLLPGDPELRAVLHHVREHSSAEEHLVVKVIEAAR